MAGNNTSEENGQDNADPYQSTLNKFFKAGSMFHWVNGQTFEVVNGKVNVITSSCKAKGKSSELPLEFGTADMFICDEMGLRTLKGSPETVNIFSCAFNNLTSLEYMPNKVKKSFNCANNSLLSLEGLEFKNEIEVLHLTYNNAELPLLRLLCVKQHISFCYSEDAGVNSYFEEQQEYTDLADIINHHIAQYSNVKERIIKCQYAMIKAGYKGNAKW
jgi:hypothetical protein